MESREVAIKKTVELYEKKGLIGKAIKASKKWKNVLANAIDYIIWVMLKATDARSIKLEQINTTIDCYIGHERLSTATFMSTTELKPLLSEGEQETGFIEACDYTGEVLSLLDLTQEELNKDPVQLKRLDMAIRGFEAYQWPESEFICNDLIDLAWVVGKPYFVREPDLAALKRFYGHNELTQKLAIDALTTALLYYAKHDGTRNSSFADFVERLYRKQSIQGYRLKMEEEDAVEPSRDG